MVSSPGVIKSAAAVAAVALLFAFAAGASASEGAGVSLSSNKAWLWHVAKLRSDRDGDGLSFERESALGTDPNRADSDGDGVADGEEVAKGYNPLRADSDQDGLSDGQEVSFGSNPLVADTDGDSVLDNEEFSLGLDPTVDDCPAWRCRGLPKWLLAVASQRSTEVSGAAAVGAALAGASVSATDANGQAIAVSATTASNGTYTLELPKDVTFPVVLWVRAQDGTQIRTIIGDAPAKAGTTITAHVTPITEAASSTLMDDPDAPPLSEVKGSDFKATGQAIVTGLFGGSVDFEAFSEDPSFTPAAEGATAPPSVTDTMLDTVAKAASQSGSGLADFVKTQSAAGAKLLQQPKFQVQLVGELTKKGNPPEQLVEKLQAAGAVAEDDPDAETTLWAATEGVPKALAAAKSKAGKDDARLVDAMIESMATLTEQRVASGGAEAAANTLKSEAVQDSVADVITDAMAVWLEVDPEDEEEAEAIAEIALRAGANAGKVVAGLSDDALASSSGKELAKASVKRSAVPQDVAATKTALKSGQSTKDLTPEIEDSSEVEEIFTTIVADDPTLMAEVDTDGDGYVGDDDAFPFNPNEHQDTDGDGVGDNSDAYPQDPLRFADAPLLGVDEDQDGIPDVLDADPTDSLVGRDSDLDGVADLVDLYPLDSSEAFDTDGDGTGDNADLDDDGDGIPDVLDSGPLDTDNDGVPNLVDIDDDNDGVLDGEDIFPLDDSKSKSLRARINGAVALRLADQLSQEENAQASANGWFTLPSLINRAYAADSGNEALTAQLNTIFLDASSEVLSNALRASSSTFVAEAQITPSGEALYLLTSNHIQRALFGLDPEPCSIYRVQVSDGEALCLLPSDRGDIEPRALVSSMEFDYSRRGIDFRADGAAVMQGFNWSQQLPSGVSGGTNSTIAWHLSPAGQLTPIQPDGNFFVVGVLWLNEDVFAVFEFPYIYQDDALNNFDDERISLYDGSTLEKLVSLDADNIWSRIVRHEGNLYWSYGGYLNGRTLKSESSPLIGTHPLLDQDGARLWAFEDAASDSELRSQDGTFAFKLAESGASMYNWQAQNGTGTDVKYSPFALTKNYVSFKKALAPDATLISINGAPVQNGDTLSVGANSSLYIRDGNQEFFVTPAADEQAFSVALAYQNDSGEVLNYELDLTQAVLDAWRADHSGPRPEGMRIEDWGIPIASPVPDRETACAVSLASGQQRCADLSDFEVLAFDQESYRSNRYYGTPVYPDNRGNAFPGIANVFIQGDQWVFYFKDSTTHQYWQGTADLEAFLSQGDEALALSPAVNGAGDTSIIMAAIDLEPRAPSTEEFRAVTAEIPEGIPRIIISLPGGGFSAYGKIPAITLRRQGVVVPQSVRPFVEFRTGNLVLTPAARGSGLFCDLEVELEGPLFVRKPGVAERVLSEGVLTLSGSADACADDAGFEVLVELVDADDDGLIDAVDPRPFDAANQGVLPQADGETSGGESPGGDADGDGVPNGQDAFPNDPAASLDLDQDGFPDVWNAGYTQQDSTTGLVLDSRVGVGGAPVDSGDQDWSTTTVGVFDQTEFDGSVFGDGAGEIGDSDGDGVPDIYDAFPDDPAASIDRDSDGRPDRWNGGRGSEDSTTGLVLDDDGGEGFDGAPGGGSGVETGLFDGSRFDEAVFGGSGGSPGDDRDGDGVGDPYDAFPDDERFSLDDDRDGLPDRFNPGFSANENDVTLDSDLDNDGLSNERELALGTDPYRSDSDDDGRPDGFDSAPLDGTAGDPVCVGNSCIEYDDEVIYHLALKALPSDLSEVEAPFAFEHGDRVTGAHFSGGLVGGSFLFGDPSAPETYRTANDDGQFLFQADPSAWADQQTALSSYLSGATELQLFLAPEGRVDNGFLLEGGEKLVRLNLTTFDAAATPLADIEVQNPFLTIYRPLSGSGSREGGQCVEAGDGFARYASGLSHHGQVSLFPSNAVAGGRMDLLGRGGENSLYLCSDTPEGRYDIALVALDGRGGRRDLSLTIEIAKARVYGGFLSWKNADFSLPDGDGDGIPDSLDAFPSDQRFAHDRDNDGVPDRFVEGYTPEIHEEEMLDSDDDGDGLRDEFEASYGTNAFRADSDGDGAEDGWDGAPLDSSVWDPVCADNRCIRYPDGVYYHFALTESFESFAFDHAQAGLSAHFRGGMVGGRFEFGEGSSIAEFASADEQGTSLWESDPQRLADQEDEFARYLRQSGGSLSLRIPEGGSVDNGFEIRGAATPIYMNLVALRDGQLVSDLSSSSLKSHLRIYRPLEGTGSREDSQCREFGLDELAPELEHHGSLAIYPSSTLSGGRMDLLGRGGESSLYVCSDTPVGEFQLRLFLLDGRGGRVDLPLTVEVLEGRIFEGSVRWFESSEEAASSPDTDEDGFDDNVDAFPEDPAASADEDQDGRPEAWNRGFGEGDSTSGLQLDESPGGQPGSGGLPPGVFDSSNWDEAEFAGARADFDGDGVVDVFDAFPQDPAASVDEDKDGYPDRWNDGKGEEDSTSGLTLDESPGGVIPVGKFNEARWGEALYG